MTSHVGILTMEHVYSTVRAYMVSGASNKIKIGPMGENIYEKIRRRCEATVVQSVKALI